MSITQAWQLGSVNFSNAKVYVARSSAVLDIPAMTDEGHDWLDEDGRSYWMTYDNLSLNDRIIVLNCWITATGYANFKTAVQGFLTALSEEGKETLTTPYGDIQNVVLMEGVPVIRETSYVSSRQVGTFTLRLTVVEDYVLKQINMYRNGAILPDIIYADESARRSARLQGENYFTVSVEQKDSPVPGSTPTFIRGDYCYIPVTKINNEIYYLDKDPEIRKLSSNKYVINYRFEHETYKLNNVVFTDNNEADFYLYRNLDEIIDLWIASSANTGVTFTKATVLTTESRNHKFNGESLWDTLQRLCAEYECEYELRYVAGSGYDLYISERVERGWPFTLTYGKGNGLYEITREALNTEQLCTVLYAYGATRNLPAGYGYMRLMPTTQPLENNVATYGRYEKVKYFDDVFPSFEGEVSAFYHLPFEDITDPKEKNAFPAGIYRISAALPFESKEDYEAHLIGLPPKIAMLDGDCAGMEFTIEKYDYDNGHIYVKPFVDEQGGSFPSASDDITGDVFTLVDISQTDTYVTQAVEDLDALALAYITEYSVPKVTYRVTVDPAFLEDSFDGYPELDEYYGFRPGDSLGITDADLGISDYVRVQDLTLDYYTGIYTLTLSKGRLLTKREMTEIRLRNVEKVIRDTSSEQPQVTRENQETTAVVRAEILDPQDKKIDFENKARNETIDPRMLAYDTGIPQFYIKDALVETNYEDYPDKVYIGEGEISITNYHESVLTRFEIYKLEEEGGTYDPSRTWIIEDEEFDLEEGCAYFMYAKLDLTPESTDCTIELYKDHREAKMYIKDNYLYYKMGFISKKFEGEE